ncbi:hypothetical protein [Lentimicrobium sp. L6]|uniref:hypothetical protein n=1 Tax=Lentimicrobium sp. L6 TaxID=2735916 RepID=UPI001C13073C|nr:hypothetical protein [Lentimicrobium sp. L6]
MMKYFEETFEFEEDKPLNFDIDTPLNQSMGFAQITPTETPGEVLGIKVRIGNEPIIKDLKKLYFYANKAIPADLQVLFENKDIYLIMHTISAIRLSGSAKVDELQYHAEFVEKGPQTIDLLPNTSFKEVIKVDLGIKGAISGGGNFSSTLPAELSQSLLPQIITFGADMKIQLSSHANFVGKFSYSLKFPIIQSAGIASNFCTWVLNPDDKPLLGDQCLIQTIAVPKGTKNITYKTTGVCKADRGLFWKQQTMQTEEYLIGLGLG